MVENQTAAHVKDRSSPALRDGRPEAWRASRDREYRWAARACVLEGCGGSSRFIVFLVFYSRTRLAAYSCTLGRSGLLLSYSGYLDLHFAGEKTGAALGGHVQ